jgi:hypothetical protein
LPDEEMRLAVQRRSIRSVFIAKGGPRIHASVAKSVRVLKTTGKPVSSEWLIASAFWSNLQVAS